MDFYIYIAGRMSGLPEHGYPAFVEAERLLRERGYHQILNPIHHSDGVGTDMPYSYYIRESIADVLKAQAICVLPEWWKSKGASLEVLTAVRIGLPIYTLDELVQTLATPKPLLNIWSYVGPHPEWLRQGHDWWSNHYG